MRFLGGDRESGDVDVATTVSVIASDGSVLLAGYGVGKWVGKASAGRSPSTPRKVFDSVLEGDKDAAADFFRSVASGSKSVAARTLRVRRADGAVRNVEFRLVDHRGDPEIGGILLISRDVTSTLAESAELLQLRTVERFLSGRARTVAAAGMAELDRVLADLVADVGGLLGARRIALLTAEADVLTILHEWHAPGEPAPNPTRKLAGISAVFPKLRTSAQPLLVDMDRLAASDQQLVTETRHLGARLFLHAATLPDDGWGVLALWDAAHDTAAEFTLTGLAELWTIISERQVNFRQRITAERRLETLLARSTDLLTVHDSERILRYVSPGSINLLGFAPEDAVGRSILEFMHPDDAASLSAPGTPDRSVAAPTIFRLRCADGQYRTFEAIVSDLRDDENVGGFVVNARDVTDLARYQAELHRYQLLERLLRRISRTFATAAVDRTDELLVGVMEDLVAFTGATHARIVVSPATGTSYRPIVQPADGERSGDPLGSNGGAAAFASEQLRSLAPALFEGRVVTERTGDRETKLIDALATTFGDQVNGVAAIPLWSAEELFGALILTSTQHDWECAKDHLGALRTIGEIGAGALSRQRVERNLAERALVDPLTGLANRRMLMTSLARALDRNVAERVPLALMFVDCDGFKAVNDTFGHEQGDQLLAEMARRLDALVGSNGTVARLGGDEFVALVTHGADEPSMVKLAEQVVEAMKQPFEISGRSHRITVSVGVAQQSGIDAQVDSGTLLRRADLAMYKAKQFGRNRALFYRDDMESTTRTRTLLLDELREAARAKSEFEVWYQPIYHAAHLNPSEFDGESVVSDVRRIRSALIGFEALIRWRHGSRGLLQPAGFMDLAEESGLMEDLSWHVFQTAVGQLATWSDHPATPGLSLAVNVSTRQMRSTAFVGRVVDVLGRSGVDPRSIVFEVTESSLVGQGDIGTTLAALRELGIKVAIDDFGTAATSFAYLDDFPVDILMIDRSFTRSLGSDPRQNATVAMITHIAERMGLITTAEGIETASQLETAQQLNCTRVQGYLLGRPAPAPELETGSLVAHCDASAASQVALSSSN